MLNKYTSIIRTIRLTSIALSIIGTLFIYAGCTLPGGKQDTNRIRFSIQNTLPEVRKNIPIIMTLEQLQKVNPDFSLKAYSVVTGKAPQEAMVPTQADDLNYDGVRDQLTFLLDLDKEETKEISILYDPDVKATFTLEVKKQSRAGIFPELNATGALESDLIAFQLNHNGAVVAYGKKREDLFSVDGMFKGELDYNEQISPEFRRHFETNGIVLSQNPNALEIEPLKPEQSWVLHDFENQEDYYIRNAIEQLDVFKSIGLSLNSLLNSENTTLIPLNSLKGIIGCGGFALLDKDKSEFIPLPKEGDYVRILANGGMRSIIQRVLPDWTVGGEKIHITTNSMVYGRNSWIEHSIHIKEPLQSHIAIVTGVPKLGDDFGVDEDQGILWSWGTDPNGKFSLGLAIFYTKSQMVQKIDAEHSILSIILNPDSEGRLRYRVLTIWDGGINTIQTKSEFLKHLQIMRVTMDTPPNIKFLLSDE